MAKRKTREVENEFETFKMSSGVELRVRPFPIGIFEKINADMLEENPDIEIPKKTIKVAGKEGDTTEEIDDINNPEYLEKLKVTSKKRERYSSERILAYMLDFCIDVLPDLDHWESKIERLEKHQGPFPDDLYDRRQEFLTSFAIVSKSDYEKLTFSTMAQSFIDDPEVAERMRNFQSNLEQSNNSSPDASGSIEIERVEMVSKTEGA